MIAAYYYPATKRVPATCQIQRIVDGRRETFVSQTVDGKREARRLASTFNAQPWNF